MAEIGTLRKENGEYTSNVKETLEELFNKFFPNLQISENLGGIPIIFLI